MEALWQASPPELLGTLSGPAQIGRGCVTCSGSRRRGRPNGNGRSTQGPQASRPNAKHRGKVNVCAKCAMNLLIQDVPARAVFGRHQMLLLIWSFAFSFTSPPQGE